jgi:hypothetical protein
VITALSSLSLRATSEGLRTLAHLILVLSEIPEEIALDHVERLRELGEDGSVERYLASEAADAICLAAQGGAS